MVQSLGRALPSTSRLMQPSAQPSRPVRFSTPAQQRPILPTAEAARMALPPLPPTRRLAPSPTQALKDAAAPPPPPPPQQSTDTLNAAMPSSPPEQQVLPLTILIARFAQCPRSMSGPCCTPPPPTPQHVIHLPVTLDLISLQSQQQGASRQSCCN